MINMEADVHGVDTWREVAAQKEREWKEITEQRITSLEAACQEKDKHLQETKAKLQKLKEDFKYNLKLLGERDQELDRYDMTFRDLKAQLNAKNAEISECKIDVDDMKKRLAAEAQAREELQMHYQQRLREKQAEIDSYRSSKDKEFNSERKEFETFKRNLQRKLTEVEEEMDAQKREITAGFEDGMRRREHEFRIQADEMSAKVLEYELKSKLLSKELDLVRTAQEKNSEDFDQVESNHRELEKKLKEKDWEIANHTAMKDANITDLTNHLHLKESAMKKMQEDFKRKHAELDRYGREKEGALTKMKEASSEREQTLQNEIRDLQSKLEDAQVEIRRREWTCQDLEKEKNIYIQKLQEETQQLKEKWDRQIVDVSRSQVNKDLELQTLRETEEKLKLDILQKKEDIERYKKEISAGMEREALLERSKTQLELDWQRRYEDLERQQYKKSEDLIKKLTRSRDEALATVKEKERELQQRETLIKALQTDRVQAFVTLKKHGIKVDKNVNIESERAAAGGVTDDMFQLQEQNENLRSVIREMRNQMEQLGNQIPVTDKNLQPRTGDNINEDYVRGLEKECRDLRQKNREMEQDADVARRFGRQPIPQVSTNESDVMTEVKDNVLVRSHIQALNDQIGALRAEKVDLSAQVKKQQANMQYQQSRIEQLNKEPRDKQVEIDQLQYELGATTRRTQAEIASLRQRISELELQLLEARKEADEYYKGNLERNMEVTALGQELSGLKVDLAQKRPPLNFGAQELMIQQLQDEMKRLREAGADDISISGDTLIGPGSNSNATIQSLQQKLKSAARKIKELAKERQQLLEMGNKLRAELKRAGTDVPASSSVVKRQTRFSAAPVRDEEDDNVTSPPLSKQFMNKLSQLEKLQYQLTRQELQYANKYQGGGDGEGKGAESSYSDTEEQRPPSILKKRFGVGDSRDLDFDVRASVNTEGGETVASARSAGTQRSQLMMSMSSMGGESLQEIWKMLDEGRPTPTPRYSGSSPRPTNQNNSVEMNDSINSIEREADDHDLYLAGRQTGQPRPRKDRTYSDKISGRVQKKPTQKPKSRNYNIRDDSSIR